MQNVDDREWRRARASHARLPANLERLGRFMDQSIRLPGGYRIGWDPILGLIPGVGDLIGAAISGYIVLGAARAGAGKPVLARMIGNVALEALIGSIPIIGDLFDAAFKANMRNLRLLDRHVSAPRSTRRQSVGVIAIALVVLLAAVIAAAWLTVWIVGSLWQAIVT